MVVPLGIYLQVPGVSEILMYEELKYSKENGYEWLDIGSRDPRQYTIKQANRICIILSSSFLTN